jgi:3-methyladenine DNA glycosylase Tag
MGVDAYIHVFLTSAPVGDKWYLVKLKSENFISEFLGYQLKRIFRVLNSHKTTLYLDK